jgi:hypothetical protein
VTGRLGVLRCLLLALAIAGCAGTEKAEEKVLAASPAPDAGYLEHPERMEPHPERAPFDRYWLGPTFDWNRFSKLYVAAVDTRHLLEMSLWEQVNLRTIDVRKDVAELAVKLHDDIEAAFREDPKHHFVVLDDPALIDAQTLMIETALVQLVPNKAGLGILATAAWGAPLEVGIPVGTVAAFADQGSASFEMRGRDGGTGEVIAMAADREIGPARVVDVRSMTWYGNTHLIFENWSAELVELSNTPRDVQVKHAAYFTLMPW